MQKKKQIEDFVLYILIIMLIFHRSLSSLKSIISQVFGTDFSFPLCLKHIKSFKLSTNEFMKILINLSPQKQYLTVPGTLGDVSMAEQFIVVERESCTARLHGVLPSNAQYRFLDKFGSIKV